MRISINVPSYKRASDVDTFRILPRANYWVHEFEAEEYRRHNQGMNVCVLPDSIRGNVAKVRNYILDSESEFHDVTVMTDDDVDHFAYWEEKLRIRIGSEDEIMDFIRKYSLLAKDWGVYLWGVNVNNDKQVYREYTPFSTLSYISASFSCFLRGNELRYDERFSLKEDYDMTIQMLNRYRRVLRVNKFYYLKKGASQRGGCATYRNREEEERQILLLQAKWGDKIVKFDRNKRNHVTTKKLSFDINPVITVPIAGV